MKIVVTHHHWPSPDFIISAAHHCMRSALSISRYPLETDRLVLTTGSHVWSDPFRVRGAVGPFQVRFHF